MPGKNWNAGTGKREMRPTDRQHNAIELCKLIGETKMGNGIQHRYQTLKNKS